MSDPARLEELASEIEALGQAAPARPWRALDCGGARKATLALMKGNRPPSKENGYPARRWPEIVAWTGFDASHVPMAQRRATLHLIVELANHLPEITAALRSLAQQGER